MIKRWPTALCLNEILLMKLKNIKHSQNILMLLLCSSNEKLEWPRETKELCHYCLQPITGSPWPLPVAYDRQKKVYECLGFYCPGGACTLGMMTEKKLGDPHHLQLIARDYYGVATPICAAPPREWLAVLAGKHGGDMPTALAEWRRNSCRITKHPSANLFVRVTYFLEQEEAQRRESERRQKHSASLLVKPTLLAESERGKLEQRRKAAPKKIAAKSLFQTMFVGSDSQIKRVHPFLLQRHPAIRVIPCIAEQAHAQICWRHMQERSHFINVQCTRFRVQMHPNVQQSHSHVDVWHMNCKIEQAHKVADVNLMWHMCLFAPQRNR
jgi:hypothetical protein